MELTEEQEVAVRESVIHYLMEYFSDSDCHAIKSEARANLIAD